MNSLSWQYKNLKKVLNLSFVLALAGFKLRNEGSYLGVFWYLLNPILTFTLLFLVFSDRLGNNIKQYPIYLLIGIIMFNFLQNTTLEAIKSIIKENAGIIKSINFQLEALVLSIVIKNVFSHFFEILIVVAIMLFFHLNIIMLIFYPVIFLLFCLFVYGLCLVLSSFTVYFSDLDNIWSFAVRLLWLGTPIFYAIEGQTRLFYINLINPMYYFITATREIIIYSKLPEVWIIVGGILFSLITFIIGVIIFGKLKIGFSEKI